MDEKFVTDYFINFSKLIQPAKDLILNIIKVKDDLITVSVSGKKVIVVGNGGSAAIASHISVDLTKNAGIRSINFNEADLITCFANDFGFENWVAKAVEFYGDEGDVLVAISSSGRSENILNGVKAARAKRFSSLITLSGFEPDNPLRQLGDINLWIDSKSYNFVETVHQLWLLLVVDLIIGKTEYLA